MAEQKFSMFKENFSSSLSFVKRRFSSNDLAENDDIVGTDPNTKPVVQPVQPHSSTSNQPTPPPLTAAQKVAQNHSRGFAAALKHRAQEEEAHTTNPNQLKKKTLLVIDNFEVDWEVYFRDRLLCNDRFGIHVEQAEWRELHLVAQSGGDDFDDDVPSAMSTGDPHASRCLVEIHTHRSGQPVRKAFFVDFVLIRQHVRDESCGLDQRNLLIGLQFGGVFSVNSLASVYNFSDRAWVFTRLNEIRRKLGPDKFPVVSKTFFASFKEMREFPVPTNQRAHIVKSGHAHEGLGKIKIEQNSDFQEVCSLVALTKSYATVEPFLPGKFDVFIQKIGLSYKVYARKSLSGHWKMNSGNSVLQQIEMKPHYKVWIDEVAQLFGGLDICAVEAIQFGGIEKIIEIKDCTFKLHGDNQEADRRLIADLVVKKMNYVFEKKSLSSSAPPVAPPSVGNAPKTSVPQRPAAPPRQTSLGPGGNPFLSDTSTTSFDAKPGQDDEDTMSNLKNTFAGIFSDIK